MSGQTDLQDAIALLTTSARRWNTLRLKGREWRNHVILRRAWDRHFRGLSSIRTTTSQSIEFPWRDEKQRSVETLETWRSWLAQPDKKRVQFQVGGETVTAVFIGTQWWSSSRRGFRSGTTPTSTHGLGPGEGLIDLGHHLGALRLQVEGDSSFLFRSVVLVTAYPRLVDPTMFDPTFNLLGIGADRYQFVVDAEIGVLLRSQAELDGEAFRVIEIEDILLNQALSEATFDPERLKAGLTDV